MKGQIRLQSELGKGTIFGIELPFEHGMKMPVTQQMLSPIPGRKSATSHAPYGVIQAVGQEEFIKIGSIPGNSRLLIPLTLLQTAETMTSSEGRSNTLSRQSRIEGSRATFLFQESDGEPREDRLSVLIAEDNPVNARVLTRRLQKLGHEVGLARDGQQCHDHFTLNPDAIDVILMDLQASQLGPLI